MNEIEKYTIHLTQQHIEFLQTYAKKNNETPSSVIRTLIDKYITNFVKSQIIEPEKIEKTPQWMEKVVFDFRTINCCGIIVITVPGGRFFDNLKEVLSINVPGASLNFHLPSLQEHQIRKEN